MIPDCHTWTRSQAPAQHSKLQPLPRNDFTRAPEGVHAPHGGQGRSCEVADTAEQEGDGKQGSCLFAVKPPFLQVNRAI